MILITLTLQRAVFKLKKSSDTTYLMLSNSVKNMPHPPSHFQSEAGLAEKELTALDMWYSRAHYRYNSDNLSHGLLKKSAAKCRCSKSITVNARLRQYSQTYRCLVGTRCILRNLQQMNPSFMPPSHDRKFSYSVE